MEMIKETAKVVRQQQIDEGIFDMELSFPKGAALAKPGKTAKFTGKTLVTDGKSVKGVAIDKSKFI